MNSTFRCKNCDKRRTWLEQSLYTGQLTGRGYGKKCNKEGTCKKCSSNVFYTKLCLFVHNTFMDSWTKLLSSGVGLATIYRETRNVNEFLVCTILYIYMYYIYGYDCHESYDQVTRQRNLKVRQGVIWMGEGKQNNKFFFTQTGLMLKKEFFNHKRDV